MVEGLQAVQPTIDPNAGASMRDKPGESGTDNNIGIPTMKATDNQDDYGEECVSMAEWVATRPATVQALLKEFPPGSIFHEPDGGKAWLIGYTESDELILTRSNPYVDWEAANTARFFCDAQLVREGIQARTHEHTH